MDESKWVVAISKTLLRAVNLWPENRNFSTKLTFFVMLSVLISMEMGQIFYFLRNVDDVTAIAATMSTISTTFQAICKSSIIFFHHKKLIFMVSTIKNDFWSSNDVDNNTKRNLKFNGRLVAANMVMVLACAYVFGISLATKPLREGSRELPLRSSYPIDWTVTPLYEIVYILQCLGNSYFAIINICGHDNMFLAICLNCVAQFIILKDVIAKISNEEENREAYVICIQHHVLLLRMYNYIDEVFTVSNFVQLFCSVTAICVSSFLIVMTETNEVVHLSFYCFGHILQLFICCAAAHELSYQIYFNLQYQLVIDYGAMDTIILIPRLKKDIRVKCFAPVKESQQLAFCAYDSSWYRKKDVTMMLILSQKPKKISALGVVQLNYTTFIKVLRLSFSFYTFLSTIVSKQ